MCPLKRHPKIVGPDIIYNKTQDKGARALQNNLMSGIEAIVVGFHADVRHASLHRVHESMHPCALPEIKRGMHMGEG